MSMISNTYCGTSTATTYNSHSQETSKGAPMLSVNEMSRITMELVVEMPPSDTSQEVEDFRREVAKDLAEMNAQGIMPDLIYDFD